MKEDAMNEFFISDIEAATYIRFFTDRKRTNGFTGSGTQSRSEVN